MREAPLNSMHQELDTTERTRWDLTGELFYRVCLTLYP